MPGEHRLIGAQVVEQRQQVGGVGRVAEGLGKAAALAAPAQVGCDEPDASSSSRTTLSQ